MMLRQKVRSLVRGARFPVTITILMKNQNNQHVKIIYDNNKTTLTRYLQRECAIGFNFFPFG